MWSMAVYREPAEGISERNSPTQRHRQLLSSQLGGAGTDAMAPSPCLCLNPPDGPLCQPAPSTLIIIVSGMCVMMLLVAIVIVLLIWSHLQQGQGEQNRQEEARNGDGTEAAAAPVGPSSSDGMVLVLFPGETDPVTFARPSLWQEDNSQDNHHKQVESASADVKR